MRSRAASTTAHARFTTSYLQATILAGQSIAVVDAVDPVVADAVEVGGHPLEVDAHLGDLVLDLGVVGHRAGQRDRRPLVHLGHRVVERPPGDRRVHAGEPEQRPGEQGDVVHPGAGEARPGRP